MGFDQRFTLTLFAWVGALTLALIGLAAALFAGGFLAVPLVAALLALGALAGLVRHVDRTNRTVARFIESLRYGDFATRADGRGGAGFKQLGAAIDVALQGLQAQRGQTSEELRFLSALVDDVPIALLTVDAQSGVRLANKAARRLFGGDVGTRPEDFAAFGATFAARLTVETPDRREVLLVRSAEGTQRALVGSATLERLGLPTRVITVEPVQGTLDTIEMAAQTDLVRVLTHEILNSLTPVTSLAATAETTLDADPPDIETARIAIGTLARRAVALKRFIASYRSVARAPEVRRRPFLARPFMDDLARIFAAEWPDVSLTLSIDDGLSLDADPDLLGQAMINLLRNAAQSCTGGPRPPAIRIECHALPNGRTRIAVIDNGPGIPAEHRGDIFLPFFTTRAKGTGVGLNLVRQIIVAHGWTIDVGTPEGGGAAFRIFA
jgi:two-component system nitrogen regulation sensor histidine kinase NtrY